MVTQTGSSFISKSMTDSVEIPTANPAFSTIASKIKVSPSDCTTTITGNGNVTVKTGNTYIFGTVTYMIEILKANLGFSTTPSLMKLSPGDCDNDRQPEMAI